MSDNHPYLNFDEYIRQGEPSQKEKALNWETAIGLQAVDGLRVSDYLRETAQKHIEGEISSDDVKRRIREYYQTKTKREPDDDEHQEADSVSSNIQEILATNTLDFSVRGYMALHRKIFDGVFKHAGQLRKCDISKKEWVLEWDTVDYLFWQDLHRALEYDIAKEREFSYKGISQDDLIKHIARFTSDLWQIHAFGEGNTRTTAVFIIQYLRSLGFEVTNDMFAKHSWYFRNALVRANYRNVAKGINYEPVFLVRFFRNLLLGENNTLKNRYMMINPPKEWKMPEDNPTSTPASTPTITPISTGQPRDKFTTNNQLIIRLVKTMGAGQYSINDMMASVGLKDRKNFVEYNLTPAIAEGYIRMLYPDKPHHPRQKYLLTVKGFSLYKEITR